MDDIRCTTFAHLIQKTSKNRPRRSDSFRVVFSDCAPGRTRPGIAAILFRLSYNLARVPGRLLIVVLASSARHIPELRVLTKSAQALFSGHAPFRFALCCAPGRTRTHNKTAETSRDIHFTTGATISISESIPYSRVFSKYVLH